MIGGHTTRDGSDESGLLVSLPLPMTDFVTNDDGPRDGRTESMHTLGAVFSLEWWIGLFENTAMIAVIVVFVAVSTHPTTLALVGSASVPSCSTLRTLAHVPSSLLCDPRSHCEGILSPFSFTCERNLHSQQDR